MKILIVDDDRPCRELLARMLASHADLDFAENGTQAIDAIQKGWDDAAPYDLMLLDIMMPGCDGHQVLKSIRLAEYERGISRDDGVKVIMTTALDDMGNLTASVSEGCQSYLPKPIDEEALFGELRAMRVLSLHKPTQHEPTRHGGNSDDTRDTDAGNALRFLIVDDDRFCRELLKQILSPFGACDVALDGKEAIDAVRLALEDDAQYDLICLDIMMPGLDGHGALDAIRKLENKHGILGLAGTKVIMTTALRDSKHCAQAFREGCESYLTKPIDEAELIRQMQGLGVLATQTA